MRHHILVICLAIAACDSGTALTATSGTGTPDTSGDPNYGTPGLKTDVGTGAADTGPGDTGPAPQQDTGPALDAPGATDTGTACPAGTPCNDGDLCTVNDQCQGGVCAGTPIPCDDGLPCTHDGCADGVCTKAVTPGFCVIEGTCWTESQPSPGDPCKRCLPNQAPDSWSATLGKACDDGDPCTGDDVCGPGGCAGDPTDCDDGNPCTTDGCGAGGCTHAPLVGPCTLDDANPCVAGACDKGACVAGPVTGPCELDDGNPCTTGGCNEGTCTATPVAGDCDDGAVCTIGDTCVGGACKPGPLKDKDGDGYPDKGCGGSDCNDADKAVNPGVAEVCGNGVDDNCDGLTDQQDEGACPTDVLCGFHTDCYPERLCGLWPTEGVKRCSDPCGGPSDCKAGHICVHMPGSANVSFCRPPVNAGAGANDSSCIDGWQCQSEVCAEHTCVSTCSGDTHCTQVAHVCHPAGDIQLGFQGVCSPTSTFPQGLPDGQACGGNSAVCQSGHCDLLSTNGKCAPLCVTDDECQYAQQCNIVLHSTKPIAETVPYDPQFQSKTYDAVLGCFNRASSTTAPSGSVCTQNSQCRSGKCLNLKPAPNTTMWCTNFCATDKDCPATMQCKIEAITLANAFLQSMGTALPGGHSMVRICKFK